MNANEPLSISKGPTVRCLVAMVDTRGFSAFAHDENDPSGVADYVLTTTTHVLRTVSSSTHLANTVIKPLGDGLLFILELENAPQSNLASTVLVMLRELVDVSDKFRSYLDVHPPAGVSSFPSRLGIGVAFGPLVKLSVPSFGFDDYVGHTINLAARLQELARNGGCVIHEGVFEKILRANDIDSSHFLSMFGQRVEVRLRNIGSLEETTVYTNAEIPPEYLKAEEDTRKVEEFSKLAIAELKTTYGKRRAPDSARLGLPETIRFMLFRRAGKSFVEMVEFMVDKQVTFKNVEIAVEEEGVCPVADAVLTREPVLVLYSCKYDECDATNPENQYWLETKKRFPKTDLEILRGLDMHPASILVVPLDAQSDEVSAVVAFDTPDTNVFNQAMADEMGIKLALLYSQRFGPQDPTAPGATVQISARRGP
jgi:class 3 adenylate cyclase